MLVMQLTWERFLNTMKREYPAYTQAGLALIYAEYEKDEKEMPDEDMLIKPASVNQTFRELRVKDFAYEYNLGYQPQHLRNMTHDEFGKFKKEIQTFLKTSGRFVGFTDVDSVVFRR